MSNPNKTDGFFTFLAINEPITQNALESIECAIAFDVRDWGADRRSAWIYQIVFGNGDSETWEELSEDFGWDDDDKERARRMHEQWVKAKKWLDEVCE